MADIFLSYASADRQRAQQIAQALETNGWSVWWDRKIVAGDEFDRAIEHEIDNARCIIVLWSPASAASEWVKNEAAAAVERGVMVPCLIAAARVPLEFRRKQAADITDWHGESGHAGWQLLISSIGAKVGAATSPVAPPKVDAQTPSRSRHHRWWAVAAGLGALLVLAYALWKPADNPAEPARQTETTSAVDASPAVKETAADAVRETKALRADSTTSQGKLDSEGARAMRTVLAAHREFEADMEVPTQPLEEDPPAPTASVSDRKVYLILLNETFQNAERVSREQLAALEGVELTATPAEFRKAFEAHLAARRDNIQILSGASAMVAEALRNTSADAYIEFFSSLQELGSRAEQVESVISKTWDETEAAALAAGIK